MPPNVYSTNNLNGGNSQDDLVYCLVSKGEVTGEALFYQGLQYKYGQGVSYDQDKAQDYFREAFFYGCKRAEGELDDRY
jgi:TPR repeat protein